MQRLLRPKSVAVIGGDIAASVIRTLGRTGFEGSIWPVNPGRKQIADRACFPSLAAMPGIPDAAFVAVNHKQTVAVIRELAALNAGGAIAYASGFREAGERGANLEQALIDAAGDMPVIGPNCYGLINYLDGTALWLDHHGGTRVKRGIAIIAQSSNIAINLTMQRRGLPIAYVLALGNESICTAGALIEAVAADDRVTAIGLYLEGMKDAESLARATAKLDIPVIILKSGVSEKGAQQAVTHTAAIVGSDDVADVFFQRAGLRRVRTLEALLSALMLAHVHGTLASRQLVSLSCSGGEATMVADRARCYNVEFADFSDDQRRTIERTTHPLVSVGNPFDYHTFDWLNQDRLTRTYLSVLKGPQALTILVLDFPREDRLSIDEWHAVLNSWLEAVSASGAKAAVLACLAENMPETLALELMRAGIAPLGGMDGALEACAALGPTACYSPPRLLQKPAFRQPTLLDEYAAKSWLERADINIPRAIVCNNADDAVAAWRAFAVPVAIKITSDAITHKTDIGGVVLGANDENTVRIESERLLALAPTLLVEAMLGDVVAELLVGFRYDPALGGYFTIGAGGTTSEIMGRHGSSAVSPKRRGPAVGSRVAADRAGS